MISKEELITTLNDLKTEENSQQVEQYIATINRLENKGLEETLKELKIRNTRDVKRLVAKNISREQQSKYTDLNDLISYGVKGNTIHIHLVPKDAHSMMNTRGMRTAEHKLIDALEQIQIMLKTDKKFKRINSVYAVSPIIAGAITRIFSNLEFDVKTMLFEEAKEDKELSKFYKMFEGKHNGKNPKYLGRAFLLKELLLSEEWNKVKDERKQTLEDVLKEKKKTLASSLKDSVNTEITAEEVKFVCDKPEIPNVTRDEVVGQEI